MDTFSTELVHDEERICDEVKKQILSNPLLSGEDLVVSAERDTIILHGVVGSLDKKWLAEDIARETFGVLNVTNEIYVSRSFEDEQGEGFYEDY